MWRLAWRRRFLLALGALAGLGMGVVAYTQIPPVYQSEAQVLVWQKRPDVMTSVDVRQGAVEDSLATHQELLKSTTILNQALRTHALEGLQSLQGKDGPVEVARKQLTVTRGKGLAGGNSVLQVSFRGKIDEECAPVLAAVLESYKRFLDAKHQTFSGDTLEQVLRGRADLEKELAAKEAAYQAFLEKSPLLMKKPDGADLRRDRLTSIQTKRSALLVRRVELQSQLDSIQSALRLGASRATVLALIAEFAHKSDDAGLVQSAASPIPDPLTPLLVEEQKLLERYGADHPEVQSVRKRIAVARSVVIVPAAAWDRPHDGQPSSVDPVQTHLQILGEKLRHVTLAEERLNRLFHDEHEEARKLAHDEIQDEAFRTGILLTRQSYDSLNKRLQDVNLVKGAGGYDIDIISPPSAARKVAPNALLILPLGALLGALATLGLLYLRETTGGRLNTPEEIRDRFGLAVRGVIPSFPPDAKHAPAPLGLAPLDPMLCTYHRPRSVEAEAYRSLRNALLFQARDSARKVLQITSPGPGDGKSTLVANLAISMAQAGKKVILVDANLYQPRLHELFAITPRGGLGAVLVGQVECKEALQESHIAGLSLLPACPLPQGAADLLTSPRFKELLDYLREDYDFVLVDSPPLLAATDAAAAAARVDGVLLAVRLRRNALPTLRRSLDVLLMVGAHVLGAVVNQGRLPTVPAVARFARWRASRLDGDPTTETRNGLTRTAPQTQGDEQGLR
jgi:capsular exopolysaccharide synthesis family protein